MGNAVEARIPATVTFYDDAERGRIRAALMRYQAQNGIGAPRLRDLIADANGLTLRKDGRDPIALRPVQRILTGKHRANDSFDLIPGRPFASIRETVENWAAAAPGTVAANIETRPRRSYVGIVACPEGVLFALMRNVTTGAPRVYWLARAADNGLGGYGHESISNLDSGEGIDRAAHMTIQVALAPAQEAP